MLLPFTFISNFIGLSVYQANFPWLVSCPLNTSLLANLLTKLRSNFFKSKGISPFLPALKACGKQSSISGFVQQCAEILALMALLS